MFNHQQIHLIETAEKLFATYGYTESSIRDIAKVARLNSSMISYYFGSKKNLMQAIIDYRTADLKRLVAELKLQSCDTNKTIANIVRLYCDKFFEQKNFYRTIFQLQNLGKEKALLLHFNKLRKRNYEFLKSLIEQGDNEKFKEKTFLPLLISTIAGTLNHVVLNQGFYYATSLQDGTSEA